MEPFRQFVDIKVFERKENEFNDYVKLELIDVLNQEIQYAKKTYLLKNALNKHVQDSLKFLSGEINNIFDVEMIDAI